MSSDKLTPDIPDEVIQSLARTILPAIREYFDSEEGQREFVEWEENRQSEQIVAETTKPE